MKDHREQVSQADFRARYCDACYWQENGKCDIEKVKLRYCVSARVNKLALKIIEEEQKSQVGSDNP